MLALSVLAPPKNVKCKFPSRNLSMMNQDYFFLSVVERVDRRGLRREKNQCYCDLLLISRIV